MGRDEEGGCPRRIVVLTLFPDLVRAYASIGVIGRAAERGLVRIDAMDIRDYATDKHRSADDHPFGGGAGLVLLPEPVARAVEAVGPADHRVYVTPSGRPFTQADAAAWSKLDTLVLLCGRYEGVDERVVERCFDDSVSIGDYVISGGELAALVVADATLRLVPGVLGNAESVEHESFSDGLLEHPHFTRPATWRGEAVPPVLLSGHHARIERWRREASLRRTAQRRPDLLEAAELAASDEEFLDALAAAKESEE